MIAAKNNSEEAFGLARAESSGMPEFWRNWMIVWCCSVGLFGVVLAAAAFEATDGPIRAIFALLGGPGELELTPQMRFSLSLLGAVTIGWSFTLYAAMSAAAQLDPRAARRAWGWISASVTVWFVVDSFLSVYTGFWRNAISNAIILAAFLLPAIRGGVLAPRK